ncbi:MAG: CDP-diacylglycerol--glycerol-3-phosphate 3-phosphatidyltransferase [Roseiflexaceae bacterium]|nr:CDP-diacylglycerol--glycerol-3-phosphate 3-phosphatidyltransferase [Roseiflexaceae bacterium]
MNQRDLPNLLGIFRIVTTPLLVLLIAVAIPWADIAAAILLLAMAISDIVDGRIARKLQVVSALGVFLDTISDKIFVAGALIPMVERGLLPAWLAVIVIAREFAVSGLRSFAASAGVVISARSWGKQKLVFTVTALIWRLIDAAASVTPGIPGPLLLLTSLWPIPITLALIWTVGSGVEYFWKARSLLRAALPGRLPTDE